MTLHEAMLSVLGGRIMRFTELARGIAAGDLYRRGDGQHAPVDQLRARARRYRHLFVTGDGRIGPR